MLAMTDAELIRRLGGPASVAKLLRYDKRPGGVQRVSNWLKRGIPAAVKVKHPELFLVDKLGRIRRNTKQTKPVAVAA